LSSSSLDSVPCWCLRRARRWRRLSIAYSDERHRGLAIKAATSAGASGKESRGPLLVTLAENGTDYVYLFDFHSEED